MKIIDKETSVVIYPFEDNTFHDVTVYKPSRSIVDMKTIEPAMVSWSSIGTRKAKDAKEYALAILKASEIAEKLNKKNL